MKTWFHPCRARLSAGARAIVLGTAVAVTGCGGGIYIGGEIGDDDDPPRVTLGLVPATLPGGTAVTLTASASDDSGFVEQVDFFIVIGGQRRFLGADLTRPYDITVTLPDVPRDTPVEIFARAYDGWGQRGDSAVAAVTLTP